MRIGIRLKDLSIRTVFLVGVLTTLATSAPQHPELVETYSDSNRAGPGAHRLYVRANAETTTYMSRFLVDIQVWANGGDGTTTFDAVPDDPVFAIESIPSQGATSLSFLLSEVCIAGEDCEFGITFDLPANVSIDVDVRAELTAEPDGSSCFSDSRDFSEDDEIEIGFDE